MNYWQRIADLKMLRYGPAALKLLREEMVKETSLPALEELQDSYRQTEERIGLAARRMGCLTE